MRVFRRDNVRLDKVERTPGGGVRIPAIVTKPGVFSYRDSNGAEIREYRPADEVAKADSLASLRDAPVTVGHPSTPVTADNWRSLAVGHTTEPTPGPTGIGTALVVNDADAIRKIDARELQEISCGYAVEIDPTPGTAPDGQRYDRIQRSISYNHVALGPDGWGRQGAGVSLRLDSDGNEIGTACKDVTTDIVSSHSMSEQTKIDAHLPWDECMAQAMKEYGDETTARKVCGSIKAKYGDSKDHQMKISVRIDGKDHETEAGSADHIALQARADAARDAELVACKARGDKAEARADAAEKTVKDLQAKLDAAPAEIAAKLAARGTLETAARKVLGSEYKFDGKTEREIRVDAIRKSDATFDGKDKSDDYVAARFDAEAARTSPSTSFVREVERRDTKHVESDAGDFDLGKRQDEIANLWRTKTAPKA